MYIAGIVGLQVEYHLVQCFDAIVNSEDNLMMFTANIGCNLT